MSAEKNDVIIIIMEVTITTRTTTSSTTTALTATLEFQQPQLCHSWVLLSRYFFAKLK